MEWEKINEQWVRVDEKDEAFTPDDIKNLKLIPGIGKVNRESFIFKEIEISDDYHNNIVKAIDTVTSTTGNPTVDVVFKIGGNLVALRCKLADVANKLTIKNLKVSL